MMTSPGHRVPHYILMAETWQKLTVLICSARISKSQVNTKIRFSGLVVSKTVCTLIRVARQPQLSV